jgi:O-antigen/teichoic acid export membrane protein
MRRRARVRDSGSSGESVTVIRRNVAWLLLSQGATWSVSIVSLLFVPNELGDELFGELSFIAVYVGLIGLVATYGTTEFLTKTLSRSTADTGHYLHNVLVMKLLAGLVCTALAIGLGVAFGFDRQRIVLVCVFCIGMVFTLLNQVLLSGYHALQQMGRPAFWNAIGLYVGALTGIAVLLMGGSVIAYALAWNLALVIPLVGNLLGMTSELRGSRGLDRRVWTHVVTGAFPFFVLSGLLVIYGSVDVAMIEVMVGTEAVGWYALAYRWVGMPALFAVAVATAFFPALSVEGAAISETFKAMANRALFVVLIFSIPAAIGIGLIAEDFISLAYGADFQEAVPIMRVMAIAIPIIALDVVLGTVVVAIDRQRQWIVVGAVAAVFNPLANLIAIPYATRTFDNGALGAAFTTLLTEVILLVGALLIIPKGLLDRHTLKLGGRIVLASAAMVPVVLLLGSAPLLVQIAMGAVAYAVSSLALKTISFDDVRELRSSIGRRGRRTVGDDVPASLGLEVLEEHDF